MRIPIESSTSYRGRNSRPNLPALTLCVLVALAAGALGYVFSPAASPAAAQWYAQLHKPDWLPPVHWFAPLWASWYALMGTAIWLIWRERYHGARAMAIVAYSLQLLLNAAWAPLFFGMHSIGAGLFVSVALLLAIMWSMREFARIRVLAAALLAPYLLWVAGAVTINMALWKLNP